MKREKRPDWMTEKLNNKQIDQILLTILSFVTEGAVQAIYNYIRSLEINNE